MLKLTWHQPPFFIYAVHPTRMEENYNRVRQPRAETQIPENELLITSGGKSKAFITHAHSLLTGGEHKTIVLRAMGKAINRTVAIAEILKRRVEGLHQITATSTTELLDVWEPKEETTGLEPVEKARMVSVITITLSTEGLDTKAAGYQAPLSKEEFTPVLDEGAFVGDYGGDDGEEGGRKPRRQGQSARRGRGRGRGRGGRGRDASTAAAEGTEGVEGEAEAGGEAKQGQRRRRGRGKAKKPATGGEGGETADAAAPES
jgi:DNA-binding protein